MPKRHSNWASVQRSNQVSDSTATLPLDALEGLTLVFQVFPVAETIPEALKTAGKIAKMSQVSVEMCKEVRNPGHHVA